MSDILGEIEQSLHSNTNKHVQVKPAAPADIVSSLWTISNELLRLNGQLDALKTAQADANSAAEKVSMLDRHLQALTVKVDVAAQKIVVLTDSLEKRLVRLDFFEEKQRRLLTRVDDVLGSLERELR